MSHPSSIAIVEQLADLLPQTQCGQCGFAGCQPYAEAMAAGHSTVNLCPPGGEATMRRLAAALNTAPLPLAQAERAARPKVLAWIDEAVCIGCTACIKACPVDAIVGAAKYMHTVLRDECTGCELCVAPCPVDCIHLHPVDDPFLPRARLQAASDDPARQAAAHAKARFQARNQRLARLQAERTAYLAQREARVKSPAAAAQPAIAAPINPADLIAAAMQRAQTQTSKAAPRNQAAHSAAQVQHAIDQATIRKAMREVQYGSESERQAAIEALRQQKARRRAGATEDTPEQHDGFS